MTPREVRGLWSRAGGDGLVLLACTASVPEPSASALVPTPSTSASADSGVSSAQPPACLDAKLLWADALESLLLVNCVDQFDQASVETVWAWDSDVEQWELLSDDGPPGTVVTGFGWDADRDVLVRYGGIPLPEQECITETWEWDTREWRQIDAAPPEPCDHIELAWDASGSQMLLVGGGRGPELMFGTWAWDGSTWTLVTDDGPTPRAHHGLTASVDGSSVELYGGFDGNRVFEDVWTWDGSAWEERDLDGPAPGPRSHHGFAAGERGTLMFGGATATSTFGSLVDETWLLGPEGWTQVATEGEQPTARGLPALGYDPDRDAWLLVGGFDADSNPLADTWEFDGTSWRCIAGCAEP